MLVMWLHKYYRRIAYSVVTILIAGSSFVVFELVRSKKINSFSFFDDDYNRFLTHRPWFRLPSYLMGMLTAMIISRLHCARYEVELKTITQILIQLVGVGLCLASIFFLVFNFDTY
jgi:hypothetical protein